MKNFDAFDVIGLIGICVGTIGLSMIWIPLALIVLGTVLFMIGIRGNQRKDGGEE